MEYPKQTPDDSSRTPDILSEADRLAAVVKLNALMGRVAESPLATFAQHEDQGEIIAIQQMSRVDSTVYSLAVKLNGLGDKDSTGSWLEMTRGISDEDRFQYLMLKIEEAGRVSGHFIPDLKRTEIKDFMPFEASPSDIDLFGDMLERQGLIPPSDSDVVR